MQAHTVERVESWDSRPFSGGFRELHDLADREFSGAVVAGDAWLFMLNGRVIGVFEGDVEEFGDASGTVYEAPHPSLALLFSMQERGGETQAKYYTNDTPLSEAAQTLADASFTGYIELSENVLSGDYYVVYYGGRSMNAAFVGASEELVTGDEAFDRADDEVGVYEVKKSPVNVTELPEPEGEPADEPSGATTTAAAGGDDSTPNEPSDEPTDDAGSQAGDESFDSPEEAATAANETPSTEPSADDADSDETAAVSRTAEAESEPADAGDATDDTDETAEARARTPSKQAGDSGGEPTDDEAAARAAADEEGVFDQEEEWRNARSVPTLAPEKSESTDGGVKSKSPSKSASADRADKQPSRSARSKSASSSSASSSSSKSGTRSTVEKLKRAVKQRDAKLEEAAERIDSLEDERAELRERVESLEAERDDLRARADELEAELEAAEAAGGDEPTTDNDLTAEAALSDTNLFVRYDSKGKPTLDDLGPETDLDAVNENLRIDHHTQFEAADATVDGEDYESFLRASAAHRFVSWAVRELPFEIRDSGHADGLADLYEALPAVDRAELDGTVAVDTEDGATSRTFDVVLRDRMGDPLVVAELNAEREPVTGEEMDALVEDATAVREGVDGLSAAMYVTSSFFEPAALETASDATGGGGFLSRSDKESFVKVGRKSGYHLCLVEDRNDAFHLTVPEL